MAADFSPGTDRLLDRAGVICAERGARLTDLRRDVLGLILEADAPAGAYDLLERLRARRPGAAPPTVYRALDFLLEHGLIHRVERLSAFIGCVVPAPDAHAHAHAAQFLICRVCGRVTEIEDPALVQALTRASAGVGFRVQTATIEAEGLCAACAGTHSASTATRIT